MTRSIAFRCGGENILVAEKTLRAAEQAAVYSERDLRRNYRPDMPPCVRVVSVAPDGRGIEPGIAFTQQSLKERLIGTWTLISLENTAPDGAKQQLYGPRPKGILILEPSGRYVQMYINPDRPNFKSGNRNTGTPEEIRNAWDGSQAHFGVWSVTDGDKIMTLRPEAHMFPNDMGRDQKRVVSSLTLDELKFTNVGTGAGGKNEMVFRRAE